MNISVLSPKSARAVLVLSLVALSIAPAGAQNLSVLHYFSDEYDGAEPLAGLTFDAQGNLYGTTYGEVTAGGGLCPSEGTVFELSDHGSGWTLTSIAGFIGTCFDQQNGANPAGRVLFGPDSTLFGTTQRGGNPGCAGESGGPALNYGGCGTVFSLHVCRSPQCSWTLAYLFVFGENGAVGRDPSGDLLLDQAGDIFGSAGVVYELMPSNGGWTESVLNQFAGGSGGSNPNGGLIADATGNLYGTTSEGGSMGCYMGGGCGVVFKLTPSNGSWTETVLYTFTGGSDGGSPYSGLVFDQSGNLYGTTSRYGAGGGGTVFELSPSSGGGWDFSVLYSFMGSGSCGPAASLASDASGNLYGTTVCGGANSKGNVFKLTRSGSGWTYNSLHDFTGGTDGALPYSNVIFDSVGSLYGTASAGGFVPRCEGFGCGVVWKITP